MEEEPKQKKRNTGEQKKLASGSSLLFYATAIFLEIKRVVAQEQGFEAAKEAVQTLLNGKSEKRPVIPPDKFFSAELLGKIYVAYKRALHPGSPDVDSTHLKRLDALTLVTEKGHQFKNLSDRGFTMSFREDPVTHRHMHIFDDQYKLKEGAFRSFYNNVMPLIPGGVPVFAKDSPILAPAARLREAYLLFDVLNSMIYK